MQLKATPNQQSAYMYALQCQNLELETMLLQRCMLKPSLSPCLSNMGLGIEAQDPPQMGTPSSPRHHQPPAASVLPLTANPQWEDASHYSDQYPNHTAKLGKSHSLLTNELQWPRADCVIIEREYDTYRPHFTLDDICAVEGESEWQIGTQPRQGIVAKEVYQEHDLYRSDTADHLVPPTAILSNGLSFENDIFGLNSSSHEVD